MRAIATPALALLAALALTACPGDKEDNVTDESGPADGDTGPSPAPTPSPEPPPSPADPSPEPSPQTTCQEELASVEAKLAACLAADPT